MGGEREMKTARVDEAEEGDLPETKKRKLVHENDENGEVVNAVNNSLIPLASYRDDDDDEEEDEQEDRGRRKEEYKEEEEDGEDSYEDGSNHGPRLRQIEVRRDCPYLDTVNRQVLDFDFEKFCSVSLSNLNVYACLVCGKYYQGRGRNSHAYTHSLEAGHHVYINLRTERVYCLPDGYEVNDPSLDDIRHVLNPRALFGASIEMGTGMKRKMEIVVAIVNSVILNSVVENASFTFIFTLVYVQSPKAMHSKLKHLKNECGG